MKIIITRNTFVRGVPYQESSKPVDIPESTAKELIALGKATKVEESSVFSEPTAEKKTDGKNKGKAKNDADAPADPTAEDTVKG